MYHSQKIFGFYRTKRRKWYELAFKDDLTDLLNRNAYMRDIEQFKKQKCEIAWIVLFDIDNFKTINDTKGHLLCDKTLIAAAERLRSVFASQSIPFTELAVTNFLSF